MFAVDYPRGLERKAQRQGRWVLSQGAFDCLLTCLAANRDEAAEKFKELHHRLTQFFTWQGCGIPERWADETLDRVAKRALEGADIEDPSAFARAVSRNVLMEARLVEGRERTVSIVAPASAPESERDSACLEECMGALPVATRSLLEKYYADSPRLSQARIELAARLGITVQALRSRAVRVRRELASCCGECRKRDEGGLQ